MFRLTRKQVRATYTHLRQFPPFCRWGLPPEDKIIFRVVGSRAVYGRYVYDDRHSIEISHYNVKHLHQLTLTMAHEMIHLRQELTKTDNRSQHNREFMRLAKRVCLILGFDSRGFT